MKTSGLFSTARVYELLHSRDPFSRDSKETALVCDTRRRPPGFEEVGSKVSANMLPSAETRACVGVAISSLGRATNAKLPSKVVTESSSDSQRGKEARASWAEQLLVRGPSRRMIPLEAVGRPRARRARDDTLAVTPLRRGCSAARRSFPRFFRTRTRRFAPCLTRCGEPPSLGPGARRGRGGQRGAETPRHAHARRRQAPKGRPRWGYLYGADCALGAPQSNVRSILPASLDDGGIAALFFPG